MKTVIKLILILILSSCASKINFKKKDRSEFNLENITESFDTKNINYIGLKKHCEGQILIETKDLKDCSNCYSKNEIYIFWNENEKSYVQKFDNCSKFNSVEIFDFNPKEYLKINTTQLQSENIKKYRNDNDTNLSISHSCYRNYVFNFKQTKYQKAFDLFDLMGENKNLNFEYNNSTRLIELDKTLNEIIARLEKELQFQRNKKTCYNKQ